MKLMIWHGFANRMCFALVLLLCLCVGIQMIGLSIEMWNSWEESDTSENIDYSIPPTIPRLGLSTLLTTLEVFQQNQYFLLPLRTIFHPPKSSQ